MGRFPSSGGSGGGAITLIASQVLAAAAASIDFSNIPATYNHLRLLAMLRSARAASEADWSLITFNADGGAHYDWQETSVLDGTGSAGLSTGLAAIGPITHGANDLPAASATAGVFGVLEIEIPLYALTTNIKQVIGRSGFMDEASTSAGFQVFTADWRSAAAINEITLIAANGNLAAGSSAYLYGIT